MYFYYSILIYYIYGILRFIYIYINKNNKQIIDINSFNDEDSTNII